MGKLILGLLEVMLVLVGVVVGLVLVQELMELILVKVVVELVLVLVVVVLVLCLILALKAVLPLWLGPWTCWSCMDCNGRGAVCILGCGV